jgi:Cdc6-like AAA superfamily ATPase
MPLLLQDWFYLKQDRDNFKPNVVKDSKLTFCHNHLVTDEILGSLERRFASNEPVKMLIYGDWGVGKTHTINHICWWLDQNKVDYPARPVYIEIGDITKSTRFDSLVRQFLDGLGLPLLITLVHDYLKLHSNVSKALEDGGVSPHVASAMGKLLLVAPGETPPPMVLQAFEYLKGRKPAGAATQMGFGQQLTDSTDLYNVLLAVGQMYLETKKHRLLFIADEAAKLEAVDGDDASRGHWVNVNKLILDDANGTFGFIYTISGRRRNLPQALFEPQLQNRLGENAFEMKNLQPADVGDFLQNLVNEFVDRGKVEAAAAAGIIPAADYNWSDYPFTAAGKSEFIDYFRRTQENSKPRDISAKLNDVAFIAAKSDKRLIDPDSLRKAQM